MYFRRKTADYFRSNFSSIQTLILRFGYLWYLSRRCAARFTLEKRSNVRRVRSSHDKLAEEFHTESNNLSFFSVECGLSIELLQLQNLSARNSVCRGISSTVFVRNLHI